MYHHFMSNSLPLFCPLLFLKCKKLYYIEISSRWNLSHGFRSHQSVQFERKVTVECCHSACAHPTNVIHLHVESCMHATWIAVRLVTRSTHPHRHQSLFFHVIFRISESRWWLLRKCLGEFSDLHYCSPDYYQIIRSNGVKKKRKKKKLYLKDSCTSCYWLILSLVFFNIFESLSGWSKIDTLLVMDRWCPLPLTEIVAQHDIFSHWGLIIGLLFACLFTLIFHVNTDFFFFFRFGSGGPFKRTQ